MYNKRPRKKASEVQEVLGLFIVIGLFIQRRTTILLFMLLVTILLELALNTNQSS
jgi:hypothetical protein